MINYKKELFKEKKKMIEIIKHKNKSPIMNRNIAITMYLISTVVLVHNGRKYVQVPINKFRLSKKLGEYSFTRTFKKHFKKKKKINKCLVWLILIVDVYIIDKFER